MTPAQKQEALRELAKLMADDDYPRSIAVLLLIQIQADGKWGISGRINCPYCKEPDAIGFSIAGSNGHVHAACKNGCVAFMQ